MNGVWQQTPKQRLCHKYSDTFQLFERRIQLIQKMMTHYCDSNIDSRIVTHDTDHVHIMVVENKLVTIYQAFLDCAVSLSDEYRKYCDKYKDNYETYTQREKEDIQCSVNRICANLVYLFMDIGKYKRIMNSTADHENNININYASMLDHENQWFKMWNDVDNQENALAEYFAMDDDCQKTQGSYSYRIKMRNRIEAWFEHNNQKNIAEEFMKKKLDNSN